MRNFFTEQEMNEHRAIEATAIYAKNWNELFSFWAAKRRRFLDIAIERGY